MKQIKLNEKLVEKIGFQDLEMQTLFVFWNVWKSIQAETWGPDKWQAVNSQEYNKSH